MGSLNQLNQESSVSIVINRIRRIIEKYDEVWRVLHEPVQNSIDAIQNREDIDRGQIDLELNIPQGTLKIADNGRGFPDNLDLLIPDATDKRDQSITMGYQGVGLKSVIYTSSQFVLQANTGNGEEWGVEIEDAAAYLNSDGREEAPFTLFEEGREEQGTTIEIQFQDDVVLEAIDQVVEKVTNSERTLCWDWPEVLESHFFLSRMDRSYEVLKYAIKYYLTTQTYLANVNRLTNCRLKQETDTYAKPVDLNLSLTLPSSPVGSQKLMRDAINDANEDGVSSIELVAENRYLDFERVIEDVRQEDRHAVNFDIHDMDIPPGGRSTDVELKDQVYCNILTPVYNSSEDNIEERYEPYINLVDPGDSDRRRENIDEYKTLFKKINSIYLLVGRMGYYTRFLGNNFGVKFIAANGIPTAHELTAKSSNQSFYFSPITFILNIDAKLNEGKKHLNSDYRKRQCISFFREAFECTLNRFTKQFVRTERPSQPPEPSTDLVASAGIEIDGVDFTRVPQDESTLIGLFYQLLRVSDRSLPTYGLSNSAIFDGKYVFEDDGIRSDNDLQSCEFKVELSHLIKDFDSPTNPKSFTDCHLLVTWDDRVRGNQERDWRVVNKDSVPSDRISHLDLPGWIDSFLRHRHSGYCPLIIVRDWVEEFGEVVDEPI